MLSSRTAAPSHRLLLEVLEPRIAPAGLSIGDPDAGVGFVVFGYTSEPNQPSTPFRPASEAPVVGEPLFGPLDTHHYYLELVRGSKVDLVLKGLQPTQNYITVTTGFAYAFFHDKNHDNIVTSDELTGFAIAGGTALKVAGPVDGDIVANVDARTRFIFTESLMSTAQSISSLQISGEIAGKIVAGGNISNVSVGKIETIQSGNANQPLQYSFGGSESDAGKGTLAPFAPGRGQVGGSLINISVGQADALVAGLGGEGGKGGDIRGVTVVADPDGIRIQAGDGGDGPRNGGVGGLVTQVVVRGAVDSVPNDLVQISGGAGGKGDTGAGGRGGAVSQVWIGYDTAASRGVLAAESDNVRLSSVLVEGGQGGAGIRAGAGGGLTGVYVIAAPPAADAMPHEIVVRGGAGGDVLGRGAAGAGGNLTNVAVKNFASDGSTVLMAGGAASTILPGAENSRGAAGGSVLNPVARVTDSWLVGRNFEVRGGDGVLGGAGGSVRNLYFQNGIEPVDLSLYLRTLEVSAGRGGDAVAGNGGAGGNVQGVFVPVSILDRLQIEAGRGGDSLARAGGLGGTISRLDIFDAEVRPFAPVLVTANFRAGDGGDGVSAGGRGGALLSASFFSHFAKLEASAGNGGNALPGAGRGSGGMGGAVSGLAFLSSNTPAEQPGNQTALVRAGTGGEARLNGAGGAGGSINNVSIEAPGDITVHAGQGGAAGTGGITGAGGSVGGARATLGLGLVSAEASVEVRAGQGGQVLALGDAPARGGLGGSVTNVGAYAAEDVTVRAGNGGAGGGSGGSLSRVGFVGVAGLATGQPSLVSGKILLAAGDGALGLTARQAGGNGGNVTNVAGYGSDSIFNNLGELDPIEIRAGLGGNGATGGRGGSVSGVSIFETDATMVVLAGRGGDGLTRAGVGGAVSTVAFNSSNGAPLLAVAAGDGGNVAAGRGTGAAGGSINRVDASHDIGLRQGADYGFATDGSRMGGLFSGAAGINASDPAAVPNPRTSGSVTNVTALAISSIVAGRGDSPLLANVVDRINLRGNTAAVVDVATGVIPNYLLANLVGAKQDGGASDSFQTEAERYEASGLVTYAWNYGTEKPIDGLIAAVTLTRNRNFMPLAFLTDVAARNQAPSYQLQVPDLPPPR